MPTIKKLFFLIFVFFVSSLGAPAYALSSAHAKLIAEGDSAYNAFNYDDAIKCYEAAKEDAKSSDVYIKLADAYFYGAYVKPIAEQEQLYIKAQQILQNALKIDSANANVYARLGQVTGQLARFRGTNEKVKLGLSIKSFADKALAIDPNNPIGNAVMGIWHYELANLSFVERFFGKIFFGHIPNGSHDTAAVYLEKAVRLDPKMIYYHYSYAKVLIELNRRTEARKQLEIAMNLPPIVSGDRKNKEDLKELLQKIKS
jgi:regulator of microtubule dynamics protein 3